MRRSPHGLVVSLFGGHLRACSNDRCGKTFVAGPGSLKRFCSDRCRQSADLWEWDMKRRAARPARPSRECARPWCRKAFLPKRPDHKFCSSDCRWHETDPAARLPDRSVCERAECRAPIPLRSKLSGHRRRFCSKYCQHLAGCARLRARKQAARRQAA